MNHIFPCTPQGGGGKYPSYTTPGLMQKYSKVGYIIMGYP